jgi:mannose-1-phosphate guanylyltransferase
MMIHAVIMAGGSGTRFWPASRSQLPKQLLPLVGPRTMLQATVDRLEGLVTSDQMLIVTGHQLTSTVAAQLPDLPSHSVIAEPCRRDTAACIGLAASIIAHRDPNAVMVVMPSDHVIESKAAFQGAIRSGVELIESDPTRIVTLGIKPTYPAESFGYIERGAAIAEVGNLTAFRVVRFREKPDRETAEKYVAAGSFFWNSGIFLWRCETILSALRRWEPEIAEPIDAIAATIGTPQFDAALESHFPRARAKSIDYAVMERYDNVVMIEAPFQWDDVGSWQAIARLHSADDQGNTVQGQHVGVDTHGCIIRSQNGHVIVTIGIDDLIVVQTPDATLVAPKHAEERIREAVKELQNRNLSHLL